MDTWIDATRQTRGLSKHAVAAVVAEALMTDLAVADHAAPYAHISAPNGCGGFAVCGAFPMKHRFNVYILVIRVREGMRLAYVKPHHTDDMREMQEKLGGLAVRCTMAQAYHLFVAPAMQRTAKMPPDSEAIVAMFKCFALPGFSSPLLWPPPYSVRTLRSQLAEAALIDADEGAALRASQAWQDAAAELREEMEFWYRAHGWFLNESELAEECGIDLYGLLETSSDPLDAIVNGIMRSRNVVERIVLMANHMHVLYALAGDDRRKALWEGERRRLLTATQHSPFVMYMALNSFASWSRTQTEVAGFGGISSSQHDEKIAIELHKLMFISSSSVVLHCIEGGSDSITALPRLVGAMVDRIISHGVSGIYEYCQQRVSGSSNTPNYDSLDESAYQLLSNYVREFMCQRWNDYSAAHSATPDFIHSTDFGVAHPVADSDALRARLQQACKQACCPYARKLGGSVGRGA